MEQNHSRYIPIDPREQHGEWARCETRGFKPNERQQPVIEAVSAALASGAYYTNQVVEFAAKYLHATPEQLQAGANKVESGWFGMDCYYARRYLEAVDAAKKEDHVWEQLKPAVGMNLGCLVFNDFKRNTGMTVAEIEDGGNGRTMLIKGKRGAYTVTIKATAIQVMHAMNRAAERGNRKDGFEQFVAPSQATSAVGELQLF